MFFLLHQRSLLRKILEVLLKDAWELHAALRTVLENHCWTSNSTPASYDVTALAIIKPRKYQRLADPLLQSGVVTLYYLSNGCSFSSGLF